jgi:hypothetical protein
MWLIYAPEDLWGARCKVYIRGTGRICLVVPMVSALSIKDSLPASFQETKFAFSHYKKQYFYIDLLTNNTISSLLSSFLFFSYNHGLLSVFFLQYLSKLLKESASRMLGSEPQYSTLPTKLLIRENTL